VGARLHHDAGELHDIRPGSPRGFVGRGWNCWKPLDEPNHRWLLWSSPGLVNLRHPNGRLLNQA
jgi:hypothetical protein